MSNPFYAHISKDGRKQTVLQHLQIYAVLYGITCRVSPRMGRVD